MADAGGVEEKVWRRTDWLVAFLLFFILSTVYYATASGITSSNDGSHYALIRTLVENRSFALQQFDDYAEGNDIAITEDGRLFSDRPPGTALLGSLFYLAGGALPGAPHSLPSRHDEDNPRLAYVLLLPVFAGVGTAVLLYALMRMLQIGQPAAATAVLMFGLGTVFWKYSSVLFSHALSSLLVIAALALTMLIVRQGRARIAPFALLGFILGFAVLTEYSNFLLVLILLGYLLIGGRQFERRQFLISFGVLVASGLISALFLALYNNANFGSPLKLSYSYAINYPWAGSFSTTFNFPLVQGMQGLLTGGEGDGWCGGPCTNVGLFHLSPILLLALPGWFLFYQKARRECLLTALLFLVYLLLFARHRTFHGFTADGRYLVPFLSLLALPLAFMMQWIYGLHARPWLRITLLLVAFGLFVVSMGSVFLHIGASYNYQLDPGLINEALTNPRAWPQMLGQVFRNTQNLLFLWLLEVTVALIIAAAIFALHKAKDSQIDSPG